MSVIVADNVAFVIDEQFMNAPSPTVNIPLLNVILVIEEQNEDDESDIVADIKGLESEIKPMIPKPSKDKGRVLLDGTFINGFKRKYKENKEIKAVKDKQLPKLHINYETKELSFNGKKMDMNQANGLENVLHVENGIRFLKKKL